MLRKSLLQAWAGYQLLPPAPTENLKPKYPQHQPHGHHHMSFLPTPIWRGKHRPTCSERHRPKFTTFLLEVVVPQPEAKPLSCHFFLPPLLPSSTCFLFSDICSKCMSLALCRKLHVTMGTVPDPAGSPCALLIKLWLLPQLDL